MAKYIIAVLIALLTSSVLMNYFQRIDTKELKEKLDLKELKISVLTKTLEHEQRVNSIKPRIIREEKLHVAEVIVETTVDVLREDIIDDELKYKLGEAVWEFAKTQKFTNPKEFVACGRAMVRVVDKR